VQVQKLGGGGGGRPKSKQLNPNRADLSSLESYTDAVVQGKRITQTGDSNRIASLENYVRGMQMEASNRLTTTNHLGGAQ